MVVDVNTQLIEDNSSIFDVLASDWSVTGDRSFHVDLDYGTLCPLVASTAEDCRCSERH